MPSKRTTDNAIAGVSESSKAGSSALRTSHQSLQKKELNLSALLAETPEAIDIDWEKIPPVGREFQ